MPEQTKFDPSQMNAAAEQAALELESLRTALDVAEWFSRWTMSAGYKRLSRKLLAHYKLKCLPRETGG